MHSDTRSNTNSRKKHCLLEQLNKILEISDSEAGLGLKVEKSGGVFGEEGECGDDDVELLVRERRSLDILSKCEWRYKLTLSAENN